MKTASDLHSFLKLKESDKSKLVDKWLEEEVFPKFSHNGQGFDVPSGITSLEIKDLLSVRGFSVETLSDYQGNFVYITLPPQGELL